MISAQPSRVSATSAASTLHASSHSQTQSMFLVLIAILAVLLGSATSTARAQTAHFSPGLPTSVSMAVSGFNTPFGVALDGAGNIYVADSSNNAVKEILAVNGSIPATPTILTLGSGFSAPISVAVDASGNVFVADRGNYAVKEILAVNGVIPASPTIRLLATMQLPSGIAVDSNGNVFVSPDCVTSSLGMSRVSAMSSASASSCGGSLSVQELVAVNGSVPASPVIVPLGSFVEPADLTVDGNGNLYVADFGGHSVYEILAVNGSIAPSSTIRTIATFTGTYGPAGVAVDGNGNVFAAVPASNAVYEVLAVNGSIPATPTIVTLATSFSSPVGLAADGNGNVFVSDAGNNRIVELSPSISGFGSVNIGTTSAAVPMFLNFDTAGTLGSLAVLTQGATGLDFANAGTGTCHANTYYAAGQSCTINVTFTPKFAGTRLGAAVAYDTTGNAIANGNLVGTGIGPQVTFAPYAPTTLSAAFNAPVAVAVDGYGNIYVADSGSNSVKEMLAVNGSVPASPTIRVLGSGFNQPSGLALDSGGNLYVADSGNNAVKEILAVNGGIPDSPTIVTLGSGFYAPSAVAVDRAGNVIVADNGNSAIKEIVAVNGSIPASPVIRTLETSAPALFIAADGSGNLYFSGGYGSVVELLAVNGSIPPSPTIKLIGSAANHAGIAADANGNLYVSDGQSTVSEYQAVNGSVPTSPTISTLSNAFNHPWGLATDSTGNVYVADLYNHSVAKLDFADAPNLAFAPTAVGSTSSPLAVMLFNAGNAPLSFPIPPAGSNPSLGANFTIGNGSCPVLTPSSYQAGVLLPGAGCGLQISFAPTALGAISGSLAFTDNNLNATVPVYATQTVTLSGTSLQPQPQFSLSAPTVMTVIQGGATTSSVQVIPGYAFTGNVTLSVNGLPSGVTASFSPNPATGASVLTLTASNSAAVGSVIVVIKGVFGLQSVAVPMQLSILPPPSFSLGVTPSSLIIPATSSANATVTITGLNGFAGSVNLAASGLPNGVTATFSPNPASTSSVLTFAASNTASPGTFDLVVNGVSGSLTATGAVHLTIAPPPGFASSSVNLGSVNIGLASPVQTLTYNFGSTITLGSTSVLTQGATGLDFTDVGSGTCTTGATYTVGQSCTVNVTFAPKYPGVRYGAVVLSDNNGSPFATAYLQGTGMGPQISFLPGTETTVASSGSTSPSAIAVDGSGNVYVADFQTNVIWKETPSAGGYSASVLPTSSLNNPTGVAVDGAGNIYIADAGNDRVLKETPSAGAYTESVISNSSSGIVYRNSVAIDGNGNVYFFAVDSQVTTESLYKLTPSVNGYIQSTVADFSVAAPSGLAVDGNGNLYITDVINNQVIEETPSESGYIQSVVPFNGLSQPTGIAVDGKGNLYVGSIEGGPVWKNTLTANGYVESAISSSTINEPLALAVDGTGNIYIADAGNLQVLKEDLADAPSLSFASTPGASTSPDSPQTVTVQNIGNLPLSLAIPSTGSNPSISANFTLDSSATSACPLVNSGSSTPGALAAGASCQLPISFTPTAIGSLTGSLVLTDDNLNAAAPAYVSQTISLSGTATQITPAITWDTPVAITYGTPLSAAQLNATATVAGTFTYSPAAGTVLTVGEQTLTATFTPTDAANYATASATVTIAVDQATPVIIWPAPKPITYGTPLGAAQLNAKASVPGVFTYSPAAGTILNAGSQTLSVTFAPADATDYAMPTKDVALIVNKAPLTITWATPVAIPYGTALSTTQLNATSSATGVFVYSPAAGAILPVGKSTLSVTFTPSTPSNYTTSTATARVTQTVTKATPAITWATPTPITYGTALSATQLNATTTVAGTFAYSPATGKVLTAGQQKLTVTFTPTNSASYTTATATVTLTVNKATPTITWATPAAIVYGTALSATQLNAKASVPGAFVYAPAAGAIPAVGTDTLTVTFTPTDSTDYTTTTASVQLKVNPAPSFTLSASPASLSVNQGASAKTIITVSGQNGFSGSVILAASGLPSGVKAAFATNPTTGSSVLTLTTSGTAKAGAATITVKGTSGSLTVSTSVVLTVNCTPTTIIPYISINGGSTWTQSSSATVNSPSAAVDLGPQPTSGGSWSWTGPNNYTSTARQINNIPLTVGTDLYVATYTNPGGCRSSQAFTVTVK